MSYNQQQSKVIADSNLVKSTSTQDGTSCVLSRTGGSLRYRLIKTARNNTAFEDTAVPTEYENRATFLCTVSKPHQVAKRPLRVGT